MVVVVVETDNGILQYVTSYSNILSMINTKKNTTKRFYEKLKIYIRVVIIEEFTPSRTLCYTILLFLNKWFNNYTVPFFT